MIQKLFGDGNNDFITPSNLSLILVLLIRNIQMLNIHNTILGFSALIK